MWLSWLWSRAGGLLLKLVSKRFDIHPIVFGNGIAGFIRIKIRQLAMPVFTVHEQPVPESPFEVTGLLV